LLLIYIKLNLSDLIQEADTSFLAQNDLFDDISKIFTPFYCN